MTYHELKEGDIFLINDIKPQPKKKTAEGYVDLVTGETWRDQDIPEAAKTDFQYDVIDKQELEYWMGKLNFKLAVDL